MRCVVVTEFRVESGGGTEAIFFGVFSTVVGQSAMQGYGKKRRRLVGFSEDIARTCLASLHARGGVRARQ